LPYNAHDACIESQAKENHMPTLGALRLVPEYRERVWGGQRLKPANPPIGEAWIVYEQNHIASGPYAGRSLADLTAEYGPDLLGKHVVQQTGSRFPVLIKLLDTADWLSLQVHPNDEQAERLEGPGHFGKTEAWHILEAEPEAQVIYGLRPGTTPEMLAQAIRNGTILDVVQYLLVHQGDTLFTRAGTVHALGPGLLLYEVQQTSDITYRVFDWNRPQTAGRALHIDQSIAVADPAAAAPVNPQPRLEDGDQVRLTACPYFTLELIGGQSHSINLDTKGESFHALTVIEGAMHVRSDGWSETLRRFETVVIPAACGAYSVESEETFRALKASV
jgi:mannose-6-phosphate isomerase